MKKYIKLFSALTLFAVLTVGLASCLDDDGYSLGKSWRSLVTVNKIDDKTYDFTLDNGAKLWVAAPIGLNLKPKYDRAIIDYTILSDKQGNYDHYIKLNDFYDVLTKDVIYISPDDEVKQDSIGHDPIKVRSIWEGGGYLNINFEYNMGEVSQHMVNLVSDASDLAVNDEIVSLEFRHNKNDDPERYKAQGYVSFDLAPYKIEGRDKVKFKINVKDFDGETKVYDIEYKYTEKDTESEN
ncbi:NigD-like N-terminal domain-containing protein [Dysgonomonas sp. Marseille-P4677]|uniref:NigD-like protein n=1 Tax=Dysgonomonas sp. Marseille-P4677 TaxID=2364790 RepID=UPI001912032F|nr:NigD-like protein [Dysgonomonas sp. Marseille-P4677]MBK5719512.1 NigD-like N-terminal domain-containing protein [Dysgonomonas sp. Marseille-P4677]